MTSAPLPDSPGAAAWQSAVARVLKGVEPRQALVSRTGDGLAIEPLYPPAEGDPIQPWRDTGKPLGIVQRVDHPDPVEAARLAAADAAHGATGLTLVLSGAPAARGFGLPSDAGSIATALEGLDPRAVALRCEWPPFPGADMLDRVLRAAERQGYAVGGPGLDLSADPMGDAAATGGFPQGAGGPAAFLEQVGRWARLLLDRGIAGPVFRVDSRAHAEAGASEAQELAAVLATGAFYLRALERAGSGAQSLAFTLVADADQVMTMAKFRALRRLWACVEEACGLAPKPIRVDGETGWRMLTRLDPWTNLLRNTVACAGAILGGADTLTVLPFTSAIGLPDAFARRLGRNTPLVLIEEAALGRVADPCAGSGAFEASTEALCQEAWRLFQDLEREGGLPTVLLSGTWQAKLAATREARRLDLAAGRARLIGVTAFHPGEDAVPTVLMPAPAEPRDRQPGGAALFEPLRSFRDAWPFEGEVPPASDTGQSAP